MVEENKVEEKSPDPQVVSCYLTLPTPLVIEAV